MSQHDLYEEVFRGRFGIKSWIPVWRPGADLRLGATGHITEGEFVREYDLKDRGVKLPSLVSADHGRDQYEFSTDGGVEVTSKLSGETNKAFKNLASADLGVRVDFTKDDAMAMIYREVHERRFQDDRAIAEEMVRSWNGGPWPKMQLGDIAITQLLVSGWGFAAGSSSRGSNVVIRASTSIGPAGKSVADLQGRLGIASQENTSFTALSESGELAIGYRGLELRQEGFFFKRTVAKPIRAGLADAGELDDEPVLAREAFDGLR